MEDIFYPSKDGKNTIHACIWRPQSEIKGVVQIIHGMAEYAERYTAFAEYLAGNGYLVCAEDHLGHGKSVQSEQDLGYFNDQKDIEIVISDIRELQLKILEQTGNKPYFLLGHSMGSFFCRACISAFGNDLSGAIIMGTGFLGKPLLNTALCLVNLNALFKGWRNRSKFIKNLAFGGYNKKIKPAKCENDWLSVNPENVDTYQADPLCGFKFTNNGYKILFTIIKKACSSKTVKSTPKDLPILLVAGEEDPVGGYGKGVIKTHGKLKAAGVKDIAIKLYSNSRHEILNDYCKDEVYKDLLAFLHSHI